MNLFEIYKNLVKESLSLRTFKNMDSTQAFACALVVSPFILLYILGLLLYGALLAVFKVVCAPLDYLLAFVKEEGRCVQHLTQAVIYIVGFPIIFFLKLLTSFLIFLFFIIHIYVSLIGYVATLGGITFSPFLLDPADRFAIRDARKYAVNPIWFFVIINLILLFMSTLFQPWANAINEASDLTFTELYRATANISIATTVFRIIYVTFTAIYSVVFFRMKKSVIKDENSDNINEELSEEEQSEALQ